jgi:glycosyltransferase involved in cell wall biosynthesis
MKILNVGSNSIHVSSFLKRMDEVDNYLFVEEKCDFLTKEKEFVFKIRSLNLVKVLFNILKIRSSLKKINPDIIHIHQLNRFGFLICLVIDKKIPIISTAWGSDVLIMPWKNKFFYKITKYILKRSNIVTADSADMIHKMNSIVPSDTKYVRLQYGIQYVVSESKQNIIYSNRLHKPLYRISTIIDYFNEFVKLNPSWKLVIAGSGELTSSLKEQVFEFGIDSNVEFVGWLDQKQNHGFFAKSKVYVSIPMSDGTSVSLLEAMSAGCLPIVSDLEVTKEWIRDNKNGIVEKQTHNPFFSIENFDLDEVASLNYEILEKNNVSSKNAKKAFIDLYKSLL